MQVAIHAAGSSAGAKLRRTEETCAPAALLAALDACTQSIAVLENRRVLYANPAFRKAVGIVGSSNPRGRLLTDLVPQTPRNLDQWPTERRDPGQIDTSRPHFPTNDRIFQVFCEPSMRPSNSGGISIPELQTTEIGRLVSAGIAHDFGNLLTTILLYSDLLVAGLESGTRLHRHAEAVRNAAHSGSALVQELMSPFREEVVEARPISWNQVVSDLKSFLTRWVGENIEIQTRLAEKLECVKIDAKRAQQIILSLVSNARDAMPMGGKITISTNNSIRRFRNSAAQGSETTQWVNLAVADTGIGMNKNTLAQAFHPFFTTKASDRGTGLGLTMVRDSIKHGGGRVVIKTGLGKGTRVTIRMPRITSQEGTI
jgi:signal transduction histidine kinase